MATLASLRARDFLSSIGYSQPNDLSIEEMVWSLGIILKDEKIEGSDGRILMDSDSAIITVNSEIKYQPRKNFIIAHELGHYFLHRNNTKFFSDTEKTLSDWKNNNSLETEANDFAKELLMPEFLFSPLCKGKLSINLIKKLSGTFNSSITATVLRYKDLGDIPIAIIYLEKGIVNWSFYSHDFILQYLPKGSKVRPGTVAYDFIYNNVELSENPELIDAVDWFPEDFNIEKYSKWKFYEYCIPVSDLGLLVCLWGF